MILKIEICEHGLIIENKRVRRLHSRKDLQRLAIEQSSNRTRAGTLNVPATLPLSNITINP